MLKVTACHWMVLHQDDDGSINFKKRRFFLAAAINLYCKRAIRRGISGLWLSVISILSAPLSGQSTATPPKAPCRISGWMNLEVAFNDLGKIKQKPCGRIPLSMLSTHAMEHNKRKTLIF